MVMHSVYNIIIVGARVGGASAAMLLARKGYKVLLVDRAPYGSDIAHGHYIHRDGPRLLRKWGLLDRIVASGCAPCTSFTLDVGDVAITGRDLVVDGVAAGYGPRRGVLDRVLVDAAVEAGAEYRDNFVIDGYTMEAGRIAGIRGRDLLTGATVTERAHLVIGADGRNSMLARTVKAPEYGTVPTLNCWYYSYWSGMALTGVHINIRDRQMIVAHPTNDGLTLVAVSWPIADHQSVQAALEPRFMRAVDLCPSLSSAVRSGRREERFYGAANLPNFLRKPFGRGWALVGDAACHKDPALGLGCGDAMRDASFLADAVDEGLSGSRPLYDALERYEHRRNEATLAEYRLNIRQASFAPPSHEDMQLIAALPGNQEAINRFFLAREGMIPQEWFFNPGNIARLIAAGSLPPLAVAC
jgi:2-polyprenyl-6-methoxyphenol hydroxylase-like FAD-dependent oxidoreductase